VADAYTLSLILSNQLILPEVFDEPIERHVFFDWLWGRFSEDGLLGVHEGTLLSEEAVEQGLEMDSWTVDSAEAPPGRDWVGSLDESHAELYFSSIESAKRASDYLKAIEGLQVGEIRELENEDWDANWKASFLNEGKGVEVPPYWRIVPPWVESSNFPPKDHLIRINPGAGFGTGTHETTQLCLQAIGEYSQQLPLDQRAALDFGSGSGILSIALAQLGAHVDGVEVDALAVDNARENSALNQVDDRIRFSSSLKEKTTTYSWMVANILRPVLLAFADRLIERLDKNGILVLSGLIASDVEPVVAEYSKKLHMPVTKIYEKGEWRALVFKK
jgi:ribosomal protein L11 methyltransferase